LKPFVGSIVLGAFKACEEGKKKEELWKFKYFTMQKYIIFKKNPLKEIKNPSRYYYNNSIITNLNFQHKQAKISCFSKILI